MAYDRFYRSVKCLECTCFVLDENNNPKEMEEKPKVFGTFLRERAQNVLRRRFNDNNLIVKECIPKEYKVMQTYEEFLEHGTIVEERYL